MVVALVNGVIFDGDVMRGACDIFIEDGLVIELRQAGSEMPSGVDRIDVGQCLIAPGFVDVQVNGGGGVMFNTNGSVAALKTMVSSHARFGTTSLIPTLVTDDMAVLRRGAAAVAEAIAQQVPGVRGIHFEGPCLNPARRGVHDPEKMRALDAALMALYTGAGLGQVVVTLAPEMCSDQKIAQLVEAGVRVSAGHSEATDRQMLSAMAAGLSGVTHIFNAMPPLGGRAPGPVGVALSEADICAGLIVDGAHVAETSARAVLAAKGVEKTMLVTDAMGTVGSETKSFELYGTEIFEINGRCALEDGTLAGSALDMMQAVRRTHIDLGAPLEDALRMASRTPAEFLGLGAAIGQIAPGYEADLVVIDRARLTVEQTYIGGVAQIEATR